MPSIESLIDSETECLEGCMASSMHEYVYMVSVCVSHAAVSVCKQPQTNIIRFEIEFPSV